VGRGAVDAVGGGGEHRLLERARGCAAHLRGARGARQEVRHEPCAARRAVHLQLHVVVPRTAARRRSLCRWRGFVTVKLDARVHSFRINLSVRFPNRFASRASLARQGAAD
jgi:hypothetical protein